MATTPVEVSTTELLKGTLCLNLGMGLPGIRRRVRQSQIVERAKDETPEGEKPLRTPARLLSEIEAEAASLAPGWRVVGITELSVPELDAARHLVELAQPTRAPE